MSLEGIRLATFDADIERLVAIELKTRVIGLYASILPVFGTVTDWVLNGTDPMLPAPFEVKVALQQYKAIKLERLRLDEQITILLTALVGDTLTYPQPPGVDVVIFDEYLIFDEKLIF